MELVDFPAEMKPLVGVRRLSDGRWEAYMEMADLAATASTVGEAQVALREKLLNTPEKLALVTASVTSESTPKVATTNVIEERIALIESWPTLTDEVIAHNAETSRVLVVDFWKQDCGLCIAMAPSMHKAADSLADVIEVAQVNAMEYPELTQRFGVTTLPTIVIVRNGVEIHRLVGPRGSGVLRSELEAVATQGVPQA